MWMKIIYGALWVATIAFNAIVAQSTILGGTTTADVSNYFTNRYDLLFVPAGYVFAIWGAIYTAWLVTIVRFFLDKSGNGKNIMKKIMPWYIAISVLNALWLIFWQFKIIPVTIIIMLGILVSLVMLYRIVTNNKDGAKYNLRFSTSIYLGWISVATIANVSTFLSVLEWTKFGLDSEFWAVLMLIIASAIGILSILRKNDYVITAVLIWAFVGIAMNPLVNSAVVDFAAYLISIILALFALTRLMFKFEKKKE